MRVLINAKYVKLVCKTKKGQIYACFNYCVLMHYVDPKTKIKIKIKIEIKTQ